MTDLLAIQTFLESFSASAAPSSDVHAAKKNAPLLIVDIWLGFSRDSFCKTLIQPVDFKGLQN
jgi:hypothetical protein